MTVEPNGPWRDGRFHVLEGKCDTCIFRPGNLMQLRDGRVEEMSAAANENNSVIVCHQTLDSLRATCRGYYDVHRENTMALRMAAAFDVVEFSPPPAKDRT